VTGGADDGRCDDPPAEDVDPPVGGPPAGDVDERMLSSFGESGDIRSRSVGERLRVRLGIGPTQWELLVSVLIFVPYPAFVYLMTTGTFDGRAFLFFTLAYSLVAIVLNFVL